MTNQATDTGRPPDPPSKTLIAMLLDRSGSMASSKQATEKGYTEFIDAQKKATADAGDEVFVTLAQFDTDYETVHQMTPLDNVPSLVLQPRGGTALLDAMGKLIYETDQFIEKGEHTFDKVIFVTMTDGGENASEEYEWDAIAELIKAHDEAGGGNWVFTFLGANQDAIKSAERMNIPAARSANYGGTPTSTVNSFVTLSDNVGSYRTTGSSKSMTYSGKQRDDLMSETPVSAVTDSGCTKCGVPLGQPHKDDCPINAKNRNK